MARFMNVFSRLTCVLIIAFAGCMRSTPRSGVAATANADSFGGLRYQRPPGFIGWCRRGSVYYERPGLVDGAFCRFFIEWPAGVHNSLEEDFEDNFKNFCPVSTNARMREPTVTNGRQGQRIAVATYEGIAWNGTAKLYGSTCMVRLKGVSCVAGVSTNVSTAWPLCRQIANGLYTSMEFDPDWLASRK